MAEETTWVPMLVRSPFESAQYALDPSKPWGESNQIARCITRHGSDMVVVDQDCAPPLYSPNNHGHFLRTRGQGLPGPIFTSIEVDPVDPDLWLIESHHSYDPNAAPLDGLYRSEDRGQTWTFVRPSAHTDKLQPHYRKSIAFDPSSVSSGRAQRWYHMVVRTSELLGYDETIIHRSDDAGANWTEVARFNSGAAPLEQVTNESIHCHPTDGQTVYVSHYSGVWKSTNAATAADFALTNMTGSCYSIAVDPTDGDKVWAILDNQLKRSDDGGATIAFTKSTPYAMRYVFINPAFPSTLMVTPATGSDTDTPIMTQDGGASWSANNATRVPLTGLNRGEPFNTRLSSTFTAASLDPSNPLRASLMGAARMWVTNDGGTTFEESTDTFQGFHAGGRAHTFKWDPADPLRAVYFFVDVGIYKSVDGGLTYEDISLGIRPFVASAQLQGAGVRSGPGDLEPVAGGQKIVAAVGLNQQTNQRLVFSDDFGASWSVPNVGASAQPFQENLRPMFHKQNPQIIYGGRIVSRDGGASWSLVDFAEFSGAVPYIIAQHEADCDVVWAISQNERTLYKSIDAGVTWSVQSTPGWPFVFFGGNPVVEADPQDPNAFYANDANGDLARWNGSTWTTLNVRTVMDPTLLPNQFSFVWTIAINPNNNNELYAGAWGGGSSVVFRSTDRGVSWVDITYNAIRTNTRSMQVNPHTGYLYRSGCEGCWVLPKPATYQAGDDPVYDAGLIIYNSFYLATEPPPQPLTSSWTNRGKRLILELFFQGVPNPSFLANFYVALVTDDVVPTVKTKTLGELQQIGFGNGYNTGGFQLQRDATSFDVLAQDDSNDRALVQLADLVWTASGGSIPSSGKGARYAVLTTDEAVIPNRQVILYWDLFADRVVLAGQSIRLQNSTIRIDGFNGVTNRGGYLMLQQYFLDTLPQPLFDRFHLVLLDDSNVPDADWGQMMGLNAIPFGNGYPLGGPSLLRAAGSFLLVEDDVDDLAYVTPVPNFSFTATGGRLPIAGNGMRYAVLTTDEEGPGVRQVVAVFDLKSNWLAPDGMTLRLGKLRLSLQV